MFKNNKNLLIIALIAIVNALGYGIIIPVLYSYSQRFGLSDFQNGLLFAIYSIFQFLSTPIIGRMSDKYGRKPMLVLSLAGTAISFLLMAVAPWAILLFLARALDGLTAGNIPVASAVITDTTEAKDRAKGFGLIGASFGFGFVFGPAISALTVGISPQLPFFIAGIISILAVIITMIYLPETNKHIGEVAHSKLFDFKKMISVLEDKNVGPTLLITLFYFLAFSLFTYAYQPFALKVLYLKAKDISIIFTMFGLLGLVAQGLIVQKLPKLLGLKKSFTIALSLVTAAFLILFVSNSFGIFLAGSILLSLASSLVNPLTQTILSKETDAKSQGTMLGLQSSYMSIGQILGPIIGGVMATSSIRLPFLGGTIAVIVCIFLSRWILKAEVKPESAFTE